LKRYFSLSKTGTPPPPLYLVFSKKDFSLLHSFAGKDFRTGCFPAVNLFRKEADRIQINGQYEYLVIPDRTAALDYEVYQVLSAEVFNESNQTLFHSWHIYDINHGAEHHDIGSQCFFITHRQEKLVPPNHQLRSSYTGSDIYISFTGKSWLENRERIAQVQPDLLCTNRELPLLMPRNSVFVSMTAEKINAVTVTAPTRPGFPLIQSGRKNDWEKASFLTFNLSSLLSQVGTIPVKTLAT